VGAARAERSSVDDDGDRFDYRGGDFVEKQEAREGKEGVMPLEKNLADGQKWEFDGEVANAFDDMLERSIPNFRAMRTLVSRLGRRFLIDGADVVDLGASTGEGILSLLGGFPPNQYETQHVFALIEKSPAMLAVLREKFSFMRNVLVLDWDLRTEYPKAKACLTMSILTLQFVPIEYRQRVLRKVFETTVPGGAFIIVEKVLGSSAELDELFVTEHHGMKAAAGYSDEEIRRKRLSLEGVLVPVTAEFNEDLLRKAGFSEVECFWRCLNFAGWLAIKGGSTR
jgi:tRNA (cmo5U34)-methyltransferase